MGRRRLKIKKATSKDLAAILEIMKVSSNADHTDFVIRSVEAGKCLTALVSDKMAGFGILGTSLFFNREFIELLVVHPEYRRRGIATALIRKMEAICPTKKL